MKRRKIMRTQKVFAFGFALLLVVSLTMSATNVNASIDPINHILGEVDLAISDEVKVEQAKIAAVAKKFEAMVNEEKRNSKRLLSAGSIPETFNFYLVDVEDSISYFYELSPNQKPYLEVAPAIVQEAADSDQAGFKVAASDPIPDGIGGRTKLLSTAARSGNMYTETIKLGTTSQVTAADGEAHSYVGFGGTGTSSGSTVNVEVDAGLSYSYPNSSIGATHYRWRANVFVSYGSKTYQPGTYKSGYDEATYRNGYIPGQDLELVLWKKYTDSSVTNAIRLKLMGYAHCADRLCNNESDTYLTTIIEFTNVNMTSLNYWKQVATIAGSGLGKTYAEHRNIKVDGTSYTPTLDATDKAIVTISGNNVTMSVSDSYS
jgi:hypothetical protein